MGNPGLEEFFGRPETIEQLSQALQQASTGLNELKGALDAEVSGLVPSSWDGKTATAFVQHWQQQSAMTAQLAQQTQSMSTSMRVLATELRAALTKFQSAEMAAETSRCYITPFYVVLPYSWTDPGADAAAGFIQADVTASMAMAMTARGQAAGEVAGFWGESAAWTFLKDFGNGLVAGLEEMAELGVLALKLSPTRFMYDPQGWSRDASQVGEGLWNSAQDPVGTLKKMVDWEDWVNGHPGRAIGKLTPMAIVTVLTSGVGAAADGAAATGKVVAGAAGKGVAEEVAEASAVKAAEASTVEAAETAGASTAKVAAADLSTRKPWWGPGFESAGKPPEVALGEIKPVGSYNQAVRQLAEREGVDEEGVYSSVTVFDNQGNVVHQVFDSEGEIVWEDNLGKVDKLPEAPPGTPEFGNQMEGPVRDLVSQRTGQEFLDKPANAPGPDLVAKDSPYPANRFEWEDFDPED